MSEKLISEGDYLEYSKKPARQGNLSGFKSTTSGIAWIVDKLGL